MRPSSSVSASARVEGSVVGEVLPSKRTICSGASPTRRAISSVDGASYDSIVPVRARTRRPYEKGSPGARRTTKDERARATRRHAPHAPCERAHLPGLVAKRPDGAGRELRRGTDRSRARRRQDWPYALVGAGFGVLGLAFILAAFVRQRRVEEALRSGNYAAFDERAALAFTVVGLLLA